MSWNLGKAGKNYQTLRVDSGIHYPKWMGNVSYGGTHSMSNSLKKEAWFV